jgi:hypothetical protein
MRDGASCGKDEKSKFEKIEVAHQKMKNQPKITQPSCERSEPAESRHDTTKYGISL